MKKYPKYKDSGIEWIDIIPKEWFSASLRWISNIYAGGTPSKDKEEYWNDGVIPWLNSGTVNQFNITEPSEHISVLGYESSSAKWIPEKSIIIALAGQGKTKGMAGQVMFKCTCNQSLGVIVPNDVNYTRYLLYWLTANYQNIRNLGGGDKRDGLNLEMIGSIKAPLPTIAEQTFIASYLDQKTAQIDETIAKKERLIELLEEERKAIINNAVTKGIDPNVKLKPSGIEWLGDIPEHWEKTLLKYHISVKARIGWKGLKADEYVEEGYGFIATPNIKTDAIDFESINYITEERYFESPEIMLEIGDILLAKDGSTLGIVNLVKSLPIPSTVNSSIAVLRIYDKKHLSPEYIRFFLESDYTQNVITILKTGMGVPHLFQADIVNFKLLIPPITEQKIICQHINVELKLNREIKDKIDSEIKLLKEYRQALIFEAVTGKIDVRN
ncbi:MAG: restriction endonuclease subunit S [Bacteroidales bacterium]|nr:restriction endonuclease subunit S [Bacteroidales bacterium]